MKYLYLAAAMLVCLQTMAQDTVIEGKDSVVAPHDSTLPSDTDKKKSHFEVGLNYQNDNVYLGRKDTSALPYYIPMVTWYHKSGLYFTASAAYLHTSTEQRIDVVTLEAGYDFVAGKYGGELSLSKYFYNTQSTSVTSDITASLNYQNEYDLGFVKPVFTATLDLGAHTDFQGALGLEHTFEAFNDKLEVTPSIVANGSTLNFYNSYYKTRHFKKRKGQKTVTGIVDVTGTVADAGAFKILDYEPGISLKYFAGRFSFTFSPTYAIPVTPSTLSIHSVFSTGAVTNRVVVEKLKESFFWTAGLTYKFK